VQHPPFSLTTRTQRAACIRSSLTALLACLACGEDSTTPPGLPADGMTTPVATENMAPDEAQPGNAMATPKPPLYIVSTTVSVGDTDQGYLVPVSAIEPGATFDLSHAVEIPDSSIAGKRGDRYLYVGASGEPTITRWELQGDDSLVRGPTLSLANYGLTRASVGTELFQSPQRAYIPDDQNRQIVVWNPEAMEITGTIALDVETEGALQPWMSLTVRPDRLLVVVSWQQDFDDDWSVFGDHVRVISIDPTSGELLGQVEESRCNYLFWSSVTSDGTAYFSPLSYYAPIRSMLGGSLGPDSCGLRVVPPQAAFDAGYDLDLSGLVGGRPAGTMFMVTDDVAFIRAWHSEIVSPLSADKSNWQDVINEAGFLWWRWQVGTPAATRVEEQAPGASEITGLYAVDGRKFLPRTAEDYSSTTLDEVDPIGQLHPTLTGPGNIWGVIRMR
jgi:hypothetical protein